MYKELVPLYETWNEKRLQQRKRQRNVGGGQKHRLSLKDRLLLVLMFYRTYTTKGFLGFLFWLDETNVSRNIKQIELLLIQIFRIPEKKIKLEDDEIQTLFFDASEQPKERPTKRQKRDYSGKKKRHTTKFQVAVVRKRKSFSRKSQQRKSPYCSYYESTPR